MSELARQLFEVRSICAPGNNGTGFAHVGPDCAVGKHQACRGEAWCYIEDVEDSCDCACHVEGSHNIGKEA